MLKQPYDDFEIILVDDGSTDDTTTPIETIVAVLDSFGANDPLGGYTLQNAECPPGWHIRTGLWKLLIK